MTKEFPVSSGSQHRKKEADSAYGEWVPVEKNKEENKDDVFPNPATLEVGIRKVLTTLKKAGLLAMNLQNV